MAPDKVEERFIPPYLSWKTFLNLILRMEKEGVPARVDSSYLAKTAPVTQGYLIAALKGFGLLNEDKTPAPGLHELVENDAERPTIIANLIKKFYPAQLALPKNATANQLWETFKTQQGETKRKAVTFFLQAADFADLDLSPMFKAPPRAPGRGKDKPKPPKDPSGGNGSTTDLAPSVEETVITLESGTKVTLGLSRSWLSLPRDERKFISELVDLLQDHEAEHPQEPKPDEDEPENQYEEDES